MAVNVGLTVIQNNQVTLSLQVLKPPTLQPYDLTGLTLEFVLKASATATDASGTTITPTVTDATQGQATVTIAGTSNATGGTLWYRLDVIDGSGNHVTAIEGPYVIQAA